MNALPESHRDVLINLALVEKVSGRYGEALVVELGLDEEGPCPG